MGVDTTAGNIMPENSTEITSRKRSDCKLQELCNNCERTVKNNEGTVKEQCRRPAKKAQFIGKAREF